MRQLLLTGVALGLLFASSAAADIRLKQNPRASGDTLTLGDIFDGLDSRAGVIVGPAPAPGTRTVFQVKHVVALARQHGLTWQPTGDERPVVVGREAQRFTHRDIAAGVRAALRERGLNDEVEIQLSGRIYGSRFKRTASDLIMRDFKLDISNGQFSGEIVVLKSDGEREDLPLSGRVRSVHRVPVVQRPVRRGETVQSDDIAWTEVRLPPGSRGLIASVDNLVGMAAKRTLRPGKPLYHGDLTQPIVVKKGSLVTVSLSAPGMTLTTSGRALEDAALGEAVKVMNSQSKRTIETTVVGPAQVQVELRRQLAVAANQ